MTLSHVPAATELIGATWRSSSYSGQGGGQCVEVAALTGVMWRTSSYSGQGGGECVEVACAPSATGVRDSKHPHGPALIFAPTAWASLVRTVA